MYKNIHQHVIQYRMYPIIVCFIRTDQVFWPYVWVAAMIIVVVGFIVAYPKPETTHPVVQEFKNLGIAYVSRYLSAFFTVSCVVGCLAAGWLLYAGFIVCYLASAKRKRLVSNSSLEILDCVAIYMYAFCKCRLACEAGRADCSAHLQLADT